MKTNRLMLNGNFRTIFKSIVPVTLLLTGMLVPGAGRAQVYSCRFHYNEKAITDYSSLLSAGNNKQRRDDVIFHAGSMQIIAINDSVFHVKLRTDTLSSPVAGVTVPAELAFNAYTDNDHRVYMVSTDEKNRSFFAIIQLWLGELHFKCPLPGPRTEAKPDGDLNVMYHPPAINADSLTLLKDGAVYVSRTNNKQALLVNDYKWEGAFHIATNWPASLYFSEQKKQVLGRKVLACIHRRLTVSGSFKKTGSLTTDTSGYQPVYLYQRFNEKERREKLATAILGSENISTIRTKLEQAASLTNEQQFRLKSVLRSLLILDSTAINHFAGLPGGNEENSPAFDIIENAIIESRTPAADAYIYRELEKNERQYDRLQQLLIKISLADALTKHSAQPLLSLLQKEIDPGTRSMVSLALSNYAVTVKDDVSLYRYVTQRLLHPYRQGISDTLQYLYIVGNAGLATETERLLQIAAGGRYKADAMFALRHINNDAANNALQSYLLAYRGTEDVFAALLVKRDMPAGFWKELEKNIVRADAAKDSASLPALRYLLDNTWQRNIDIKSLLTRSFQMEAYREEVEDFKKQSSLCK